jgi:hypothetical protein
MQVDQGESARIGGATLPDLALIATLALQFRQVGVMSALAGHPP